MRPHRPWGIGCYEVLQTMRPWANSPPSFGSPAEACTEKPQKEERVRWWILCKEWHYWWNVDPPSSTVTFMLSKMAFKQISSYQLTINNKLPTCSIAIPSTTHNDPSRGPNISQPSERLLVKVPFSRQLKQASLPRTFYNKSVVSWSDKLGVQSLVFSGLNVRPSPIQFATIFHYRPSFYGSFAEN